MKEKQGLGRGVMELTYTMQFNTENVISIERERKSNARRKDADSKRKTKDI